MIEPRFHVSQRLSFNNQRCTIRYIGPVQSTTGTWLGVEWDNPALGKHPGRHNDIEYFKCRSSSSTAGSFIRPTRPHDATQSFLEALREKYVATDISDPHVGVQKKQIYFNGKLAEEIGFEKVAKQQAVLGELRIVVLDGQRITGLKASGNEELRAGEEWNDLVREIESTCGSVVELDLSRNILENWADVVGICLGLKDLKNGNRFHNGLARSDAGLKEMCYAFKYIEELFLDGTLMEWDEVIAMLSYFPALQTLSLASNELKGPLSELSTSNISSINLAFNPLHSLATIAPLFSLSNLKSMIISGCGITTLPPLPHPFPKLQTLDLSANIIMSLTSLSSLPISFPELTSLRCNSNPFYNDLPVEEAHMLTLARIPTILMLNRSKITAKEREDAELWYLSKIRLEIATEGLNEEQVTQRHPLWKSLSTRYSQEDDFESALLLAQAGKQEEELIDPNSLGAHLVDIEAYLMTLDGKKELTFTLPKSITVPRLKSLIGRQIGILPLQFRLIHETGELDPVAQNLGNPGRVGEGWKFVDSDSDSGEEEANTIEDEKWVKREVDLGESPRPIGYWLDSKTATIRIEMND